MTNLQLHSKREPQLALPSSVAEANSGVLYTGMLKGYYVPNTNYYNVLPIDVEIAKDKSTIPIGIVDLDNSSHSRLMIDNLKNNRLIKINVYDSYANDNFEWNSRKKEFFL